MNMTDAIFLFKFVRKFPESMPDFLSDLNVNPTPHPSAIFLHTECPRRNVPDFGRVFLMLKYTDITQNTYVQS
jgi:hypothetical protein